MEEEILVESSIGTLKELLFNRSLSAVSLTQTFLRRISRLDRAGPRINSVLGLAPDAIQRAEELDRELDNGKRRSALHGIPYLVKDNINTKIMPTTAGSKLLRDYVPSANSTVIERLQDAGAILLGKTNLDEFSEGIIGLSSFGGQTLNPYHLGRNPGGSSGGTGAAISSGFAVFGLGTDTGGSIRYPAAHNNLFGLRPTYELLEMSGIIPVSQKMDTVGPLVRHACDLAYVMDILVPKAAQQDYLALLERALVGEIRLGVLNEYFGRTPIEAQVTRVVFESLRSLTDAGFALIELDDCHIFEHAGDTAKYELEVAFDDFISRSRPPLPLASLHDVVEADSTIGGVRDSIKRKLRHSQDSSGFEEALKHRERVRGTLTDLLDNFNLDALVYPTFKAPARPLGDAYNAGGNSLLSAVAGFPALSVPMGFSEGIPVGADFLGLGGSEPRLISIARRVEQALNNRRRPSFASGNEGLLDSNEDVR